MTMLMNITTNLAEVRALERMRSALLNKGPL